jgi:tricarballylate dehydrogenase
MEVGVGRPALSAPWDVVVIGGGNAALVAAISARAVAERVLVLERAPVDFRGGNTRHTRNVRCVHNHADDYNTGAYEYDELWKDLCGVGTGPSNEELAALTVAESETVPGWMSERGIRWQRPLTGTLHLGRTNRFFLGGGKALINTYHRTVARLGITVEYEVTAEQLVVDGDQVTAVLARADGQTYLIPARAVVCAAGGFEANLEWLGRYWGEAAKNYIIRGPRYNDGTVLQALYDLGAASAGEQKGFHAIAVDARAPRFDGGIATRLDIIPFGITVNRDGQRFYDEGEEIWPKRYAIWGRNIAEQPGQIAYAFWDHKVNHLFLPPMYPPTRGETIEAVTAALGLDVAAVGATLSDYNAAVKPGMFDPAGLDDCRTCGLEVPKSHWAQRLDTPPYYGIAMRPGITFTYMGVRVDRDGRVIRTDDSPFANVFAAGEIMSGNVLSSGYLAGFGLTIGSVWGRIAGRNAARVACE